MVLWLKPWESRSLPGLQRTKNPQLRYQIKKRRFLREAAFFVVWILQADLGANSSSRIIAALITAIAAPQEPFPHAVLISRSGQRLFRISLRKSFSHDSAAAFFFVYGVIVNKRLQGFLNVDRGDDPHRPRSFSRDPSSKSEPA
jgi:hypothetical protein